MTNTRLNDTRPALALTADQADELFARIARETIAATADAARMERRMAALKEEADAMAAAHREALRPMEEMLCAYIMARPERFAKPRMRRTQWGAYGLRTATRLDVSDEEAAKAYCKANGVPAVVVTERLDRKALEKAISDGLPVPGCEIQTGELAKYDVARPLLDAARK